MSVWPTAVNKLIQVDKIGACIALFRIVREDGLRLGLQVPSRQPHHSKKRD